MNILSNHKEEINHLQSATSPFQRVQADPQIGLSSSQVQLRVKAHAVNHKVESNTNSTKEIIRSNTFTYFNLIFVVIAVLLILVGSFRDLTFFPVILANTCIGIFQELRSKKVLDNLSLLNAVKTTVIRDGNHSTISAQDLVLDDIIILTSGNQIPADASVLEGEVNVNESLITGESNEILKEAGASLLSGSFIVSGNCVARLTAVGADSYISKLELEATVAKRGEQSEMIRSLNKLVKTVGIIIIPIGILLFGQQFFFSDASLRESITSMVAAIIGMIPEGLYLLTSVSLAVSAMRLAKQKVLLHDMKSIETLARVDVLCVDKTGTITEPGMEVDSFEAVNGHSPEEVQSLLADFSGNMSADNATMIAMQSYFQQTTGKKALKVQSFSSVTKYSGVQFEQGTFVIGAPEFILRDQFEAYEEQINSYASRGYRVLVFAQYSQSALDGGPLSASVEPYGFVMLTNPIRQGARQTFQYFAQRDVAIKVISGDNPMTVSEIASKAGIANAESYVDATTLQTQDDFLQAVRKYTVFGRVTPNQKRFLVQSLQSLGHTVAMTGDGVNDVLALKDADCSVAMASGSEAASQVAQVVLLDSDFTRMPSVVMEGRRVVNNIQRTASLYLVKNIFSMLLAIFSVLLMLNYPLEPSQVSLISMFTIGIPSFFLALEPNKNSIRGHFLTNVLLKALPAGLTDFLVVSALVLFCRTFEVDAESMSTCCSVLIAIVGFMILYQIASPMNKAHIALMAGVIGGWLICLIFFSKLFAISVVSTRATMLTVIFAIITEPALRYLNLLVVNLRAFYLKIKHKIKKSSYAS